MTDHEPIESNAKNVANPSSSDSNDALSLKDSFKVLWKGWSDSIVVKILSLIAIAIIALFVVFILVTTSYAAVKLSCDNDLNKEESNHKICKSNVAELKPRLKTIRDFIDDESKKIDQLKKDINELNKNIDDVNNTIRKQQNNIKELEEQHERLLRDENSLTTEINGLKKQKDEKQEKLKQLKVDLSKFQQELELSKEKKMYYIIGGGVGIAIDIASLALTGYYRYKINEVEDETNRAEERNNQLKGQLKNLKGSINRLEDSIKTLKSQIDITKKNIILCKNDTDKKIIERAQCLDEETKVYEKAKVLISLGIEQIVYNLISEKNGTSIRIENRYNASERGFEVENLKKAVKGLKHNLLVMRSNTGYVFGAYFNSLWDGDDDKDFKEDDTAFTFSTMHNKVCRIKNPKKAVKLGGKHLVDIGDGEIIIEESDTVSAKTEVNAGKSFMCGNVDPHGFYSDKSTFEIEDMMIYYIEHTPKE